MVFGQGSEGGTHLPALCRAVTWQVVSIIITQGQEALQAGTAVIRARTIIAVWQQQHQACLLTPPLLSYGQRKRKIHAFQPS